MLENVEGKKVLKLVWQERDGPPVTAPRRKGFGSHLIEQVIAYKLRGKVQLEFARAAYVLR